MPKQKIVVYVHPGTKSYAEYVARKEQKSVSALATEILEEGLKARVLPAS